jgi:hypothetical protein
VLSQSEGNIRSPPKSASLPTSHGSIADKSFIALLSNRHKELGNARTMADS